MEIKKSEETPFLNEVFDVKMTGRELATIYAIIGKVNSDGVERAIRAAELISEDELIKSEHNDSVSYKIFGDIRNLLRARKQFLGGY